MLKDNEINEVAKKLLNDLTAEVVKCEDGYKVLTHRVYTKNHRFLFWTWTTIEKIYKEHNSSYEIGGKRTPENALDSLRKHLKYERDLAAWKRNEQDLKAEELRKLLEG